MDYLCVEMHVQYGMCQAQSRVFVFPGGQSARPSEETSTVDTASACLAVFPVCA